MRFQDALLHASHAPTRGAPRCTDSHDKRCTNGPATPQLRPQAAPSLFSGTGLLASIATISQKGLASAPWPLQAAATPAAPHYLALALPLEPVVRYRISSPAPHSDARMSFAPETLVSSALLDKYLASSQLTDMSLTALNSYCASTVHCSAMLPTSHRENKVFSMHACNSSPQRSV